MNNTKSVSASPSQSKANRNRQSRQKSYREKFSRPHMIIPQEDMVWVKDQPNSVKTLFMECWISDPYGSRWQVLNHSLSSGSFKRAKKILAEKGLFLFKTEKSIRDLRETAYYKVINLHGSRRNDFWLSTDSEVNLEDHESALKDHESALKDHKNTLEDHQRSSISIETQTQQAFQNPSGALSGSSSGTPQGAPEELAIESEEGDRHRQSAFDERIDSAPPQDEQKKAVTFSLDKKLQNDGSRANPDPRKDSPAPLEKTIPYNPLSEEAIKITNAKNLSIEAEQKTEEYQNASKEALARIRAKLAKKKLDLEVGTGRKELQVITEELKCKLVNRPDPEDYPPDE